ncbi:MAG TPA: cytochrome c [Microvirga sp.]|jgi:mono/diheme cytochrome c family protein
MRKVLGVLLVLAALGAAGFYGLTMPATYRLVRGETAMPTGHTANAENGRLLFYAGGCASCHATPNQDERTVLGGGYALKSPFGTFYVPNISPHPQDGIGAWDGAAFVRAMREGTSPDGRHYYPAFPYTSYQRMPATDLLDLFAYMRTLPAVAGRAQDHDLPFPFNIRRGVGLWKLAFLDGRPFVPDQGRSASLNRGAYLVEGPGHCAECHSERNLAGALIEGRRYAGGPDPEGRGTVPNITPHPSGIGGWTEADLAQMLKTGETPNFVNVGGPMGSVVRNTAELPEPDRAAMGEYLLSLPPREAFKGPQAGAAGQ